MNIKTPVNVYFNYYFSQKLEANNVMLKQQKKGASLTIIMKRGI